MAIAATSNVELSTTFNEWRLTSNIIRQHAADTLSNNTFSGTQTFNTIAFNDGSVQATSADNAAIPFAIAL